MGEKWTCSEHGQVLVATMECIQCILDSRLRLARYIKETARVAAGWSPAVDEARRVVKEGE